MRRCVLAQLESYGQGQCCTGFRIERHRPFQEVPQRCGLDRRPWNDRTWLQNIQDATARLAYLSTLLEVEVGFYFSNSIFVERSVLISVVAVWRCLSTSLAKKYRVDWPVIDSQTIFFGKKGTRLAVRSKSNSRLNRASSKKCPTAAINGAVTSGKPKSPHHQKACRFQSSGCLMTRCNRSI